mgnify:FL=1
MNSCNNRPKWALSPFEPIYCMSFGCPFEIASAGIKEGRQSCYKTTCLVDYSYMFLYLIRSTNCNFSTSLVFFKFIQSLFQYKNLHPYLINNLLKLFVTLSGWIFKSPIIIKRSFDKRTSHITTH